MREMYKALQNKPKESDPNLREESIREQVVLGRKIEDLDREINKILNNQAATIIAELYDDVHAMIVELAHDRGLTVVFSYPDAVTPADEENPLLKEAKLKPPAAQPLYIDPSADYTDELLERLNAKFPVERDEN
jgi:Skp family chaperone for outer membrane proteins